MDALFFLVQNSINVALLLFKMILEKKQIMV